MNILHTRRRIGLALMLAGTLALPIATPVDAAAQNRPGQVLERGGNGNGKQKQQAQRGQKARQGKAQQKADRAQNQAQRQKQQANRAQDRAHKAQAQANRARQNERRVEQQARRQHQEARQAQQHARQAQVRAAEQRAQARAARERAQAQSYRAQQHRAQEQRVHQRQQRQVQQQRVHQRQVQQYRAQQHRAQQHRSQVRRHSGGRHHPFYASPIYLQRHRPQWRNNVFAVDGYLQDDGYQCVQLRDDQGNPYILEGRVEGLFAGDHVRLVAREAPFSSCGGYGRPVVVTRVVRVWADSHHRSAYYQTNIDGAFDNWAHWRRGDDWLREPRFYDGAYDAGYTDDYYFDGYDYDQDDYAYYGDDGW